MNLRYHKISVDGENYYRDCNNYLGKFGELISEDELIERLLDNAVADETEITDVTVEIALDDILSEDSRQILEHYIMYLKHLAGIE